MRPCATTTKNALVVRELRWKVVLWAFGFLDVVNNVFKAKFRVTVFWTPTRSNERSLRDLLGGGRVSKRWVVQGRDTASLDGLEEDVPKVGILNAVSFEAEGAEVHALRAPGDGVDRVLMRWTCMYVAELSQPQLVNDDALSRFPYDAHDLYIDMGVRAGPFTDWVSALARPEDNENLGPSDDLAAGYVSDTVHSADFDIERPRDSAGWLTAHNESGNRWPTVRARVHVWRKHAYYDWNILSQNLLITSLVLTAFALPYDKFGERASIILGVLFGFLVAMRTVVDGQLPKLERSTLAQREFHASTFFIEVALVESAGVHIAERRGAEPHTLARWDSGCGVLLTLWLFVRAVHLLIVRHQHVRARPNTLRVVPGNRSLVQLV